MVVTLGAVEKHVSNIFAKLDLPAGDDDHRRVLAVLAYLRATGGRESVRGSSGQAYDVIPPNCPPLMVSIWPFT